MNNKGYTLTELLITVAIIGILAAIAIPGYIGQQRNAARTEAIKHIESLRLLEEQFFAENATYVPPAGVCAPDTDNIAAIQAVLPGFQPEGGLSFSYCVQLDVDIFGAATPNCFTAMAIANAASRNAGEAYSVDCINNRNF